MHGKKEFDQVSDYKEIKKELDYLRFFYSQCDFGPSDDDVFAQINSYYEESGEEVPEGYR